MSEAFGPDMGEDSFAESLREGIRQLRQERGPCPEPEVLEAFFQGRLVTKEADPIRAHLEACGLCDVALSRLHRTASLRWRGESAWAFFRGLLLPYALVALLLYPAYRGLFPLRPAPSPFQGSQALPAPARSFTLDNERGGSPAKIRLATHEDFFILSFLMPVRVGFHYSTEMVAAAGASIGQTSDLVPSDELGHCQLICSTNRFQQGAYTLKVRELDDSRNPTGREFLFPFQIQEPRP